MRADLAGPGTMEAMLEYFADVFDIASASIAPATATTWVPGESFAFNLPAGYPDAYCAADDPTQRFLADQPGGVFCLGRSFDADAYALFDVGSHYGVEDAAVGNIDVLGAPQKRLILLADRWFDETHETMLRGVYDVIARSLAARERALRPDLPYLDIDRESGSVVATPAAIRFLEARFGTDSYDEGRLIQALTQAAAEMVRRGTRTQNFAHGMALSYELHPSERSKMTVLLHDALSHDAPHPAEALLTPRQQQVARSAAAGATTRAIAEELSISVDTVKEHLNAVYKRLGVGSRGELMVLFSS